MLDKKFFGYKLSKDRAHDLLIFIGDLFSGDRHEKSNDTLIDISNVFRMVRLTARKYSEKYIVFGTFVPVDLYNGVDDLLRDISVNHDFTIKFGLKEYTLFKDILDTLYDELEDYIKSFN